MEPTEPEAPTPDTSPPPEPTDAPEPEAPADQPPPPEAPPQGGGSYDAFASQPADEVQSAPSTFGGNPVDQAVFDADPMDDEAPTEEASSEASGEASEAGEPRKPRKRRVKADEPDINTAEEYEEFVDSSTQVLDLIGGIVVRKQLAEHINKQTVHPEAVEKFIGSLDLTDRERRKISIVAGRVLAAEEVKLQPIHQLVPILLAVYGPRVSAVMSFKEHLNQCAANGTSIGRNDGPEYHAKGEAPKEVENSGFS